ncbi:hypothetical protein ILUMI_04189 [Ignelater luminosus]|uniref:Uncharacterized protein n=1 Tax=Ignelater luminosus TaxID=2038154 RepID=A0A8K0DD26_IGNLU|nr:hypothetical protein ILUMI_04189 [Ignelater luminosus]
MDTLARHSGSTNNGVLENCDVIQIRTRLLTIQPLQDTFDQLQLQIENASEDLESEPEHITEFKKKHHETISDAEDILEKLSTQDNLPAKPSTVVSCHELLLPGPVVGTSDVVSINGVVSQSKMLLEEGKSTPVPAPQILVLSPVIGKQSKPPTGKPRLPPIDLPQFSGAHEQCFFLVGNFEALVNRNGNVAVLLEKIDPACKKRHSSLLHLESDTNINKNTLTQNNIQNNDPNTGSNNASTSPITSNDQYANQAHSDNQGSSIVAYSSQAKLAQHLLSTAIVHISDHHGNQIKLLKIK